jgi:hypothetical protein
MGILGGLSPWGWSIRTTFFKYKSTIGTIDIGCAYALSISWPTRKYMNNYISWETKMKNKNKKNEEDSVQ